MKPFLICVLLNLITLVTGFAQNHSSDSNLFHFQANYRHSFAATKFQQYIPEFFINVGSFEMSARYNTLLQEHFKEKESFSTFDLQFIGFTTPHEQPIRFTLSLGILTQPNKRVQPELTSSFIVTTNDGLLRGVVKGRATTYSPYDGRSELTIDLVRVISGNFKHRSNISLGLSGLISNYRVDGKSIPVETVAIITKFAF